MLQRFIFVLLLFTIIRCQPVDITQDSSHLLFSEPELALQLTPGNAPVETPLQLQLSAENVASISGELTGISMYMGRIPLKFSQHQEVWQTEFLLGACSDPNMLWQLELDVQFKNGEKRKVKQQFTSSW